MSYSARLLLDSINLSGCRLTTAELTYPRFVHSELMTHRVFSRNSSSSRAIPISKMIENVVNDPVVPVYWGKNQAGMQAHKELIGEARQAAEKRWLRARDDAVEAARALFQECEVHKQIVNRLLEPWMWITVIVSATEWENFLNLRQDWRIPVGQTSYREMLNPEFPAQPEIQVIAYMFRCVYEESTPVERATWQWHLPLVEGYDMEELVSAFGGYERELSLAKISVGRAARVSYLTHEGKRDPSADLALHDRLLAEFHMSPYEHAAIAMPDESWYGNFRGWRQYRKKIPGESVAPRP